MAVMERVRTVTIREATLEDVPQLVTMGHQFLTQTAYQGRIADNPDAMAAMAIRLIEQSDGLLLIAEQDGDAVGMIGFLCFAHHLSGERIAAEVFWWVSPDVRGSLGIRLLKRAEQWAKAQGVSTIQMVAPTERVGLIYQKLGYEPVERAYQRTL